MKILLAVDGSTYARKACEYVVGHWRELGDRSPVTLIHVNTPLPVDIEVSLGPTLRGGGLQRYHEDCHRKALSEAEEILREAGIAFEVVKDVGIPAEVIAEAASQGGFDMVVMGSHGRGALGALLLGSVTARVLATCRVPVLIVR